MVPFQWLGTHTFRRAAFFAASAAALLVACSPGPRVTDRTMHVSAEQPVTTLDAPPPPALAIIGDLRKPESVLYDPDQDVYFISNINGGMLEADGNGFISRVDAKTLQANVEWIASGRNGVTLDGPKGMAIVGDTLYVSDVKAVRKFDRRSGAPLGAVELPGAVFINDLATNGHDVFASDTAFKMGPGVTFIPTNTDAVWKISGDRAEKLASGPDLHHPNGLDVIDGKLWVVTFGDNEIYRLDGGKKTDVTTTRAGQLDGLTHLADGTMLVSSWNGNVIYRGKAGGDFHAILAGMDAPADIGYDAKRHHLLIPHPGMNEVTIHEVQ